jgi:hypothetical protein
MAETTAALPIAVSRQHDEMQRRGSSSDAGQLTAVLGVHGSPVLPARTSGLPIRARA